MMHMYYSKRNNDQQDGLKKLVGLVCNKYCILVHMLNKEEEEITQDVVKFQKRENIERKGEKVYQKNSD